MLKFQSVDQYIGTFSPEVQKILTDIRHTVKKAAPEAEESIAYGMPGYKLNGQPLVYFAAFKNHIGFYPLPIGIESFKAELAKYKHAKGSVQFPINEPIPFDLIKKIVKFRLNKENI